jgi:3-methyl-2-oxobutanoate hydroxymethyltransferase
VVLECIPSPLAAEISAALKIPTIGIGAGVGCDGQILVLQDLLGLNLDFHPRFVRTFADIGQCVLAALDAYDRAVKAEQFPAREESFT